LSSACGSGDSKIVRFIDVDTLCRTCGVTGREELVGRLVQG
jgi:hypothetical protein